MLHLRTLLATDIAIIQNWPPYPPEFEKLDYALRDKGWLAEFYGKPGTRIYVAEQGQEIIAFTILSNTQPSATEFRIALHADKIGQGLGKKITAMTLEKGFAELCLSRIHLIVRVNNHRAVHLYKSLGFLENGHCLETINGREVYFLAMVLSGST